MYPKKKYDLIQLSCFEEIQGMLLGSLNCWNDLDVFRLPKREIYFNRLGVFPHHPDDLKRMKVKIAAGGDLTE